MAIRVQRHANVSKQATLFDGLNVSPLKCRACGCDLNRFVHEGMNHISNVDFHLKTQWKCKYIPINDTYSELSVFWPSDTEIWINELRFSYSVSLSFKTRLMSVICFCGNIT